MTPDPIIDEIAAYAEEDMIRTTQLHEMVRQRVGLTNLIRPVRPMPDKKKPQRVIRQGGSAARKILKGQR